MKEKTMKVLYIFPGAGLRYDTKISCLFTSNNELLFILLLIIKFEFEIRKISRLEFLKKKHLLFKDSGLEEKSAIAFLSRYSN